MASLLKVRGIENLSDSGKRAVIDVANSLGINPDWLVTVMSFESSGSFDPGKKNAAGSGATGLIQFMPTTAGLLGTSTAQLAQMSQEEQIRGPVYQYLKNHGRLGSLEDTYLAVFYPSAIGKPDDYVVGTGGSKVYEQNKGFDTQGTGQITKRMITSTIRNVFNAAGGARVEVPGASPFGDTLYTLDSSGSQATPLSIGEPGASSTETSEETSETAGFVKLFHNWLKGLDT